MLGSRARNHRAIKSSKNNNGLLLSDLRDYVWQSADNKLARSFDMVSLHWIQDDSLLLSCRSTTASEVPAVAISVRRRASRFALIRYDACRKLNLDAMNNQIRLPGGDLEYEVLAELWELGSASVRDLHSKVGDPKGLVYTTTAKVLERLHAKRLVSRERRGMSFVYRPRVGRDLIDAARFRAALTRLLGSNPRSAVATLVDAVESLDPVLIDELDKAIASRRRSKDGT
jgi:BlaI family penicillinase repressor